MDGEQPCFEACTESTSSWDSTSSWCSDNVRSLRGIAGGVLGHGNVGLMPSHVPHSTELDVVVLENVSP